MRFVDRFWRIIVWIGKGLFRVVKGLDIGEEWRVEIFYLGFLIEFSI